MPERTLTNHTKQVSTIAISNNQNFVTGGRDGLINVYYIKNLDQSLTPRIIDEPWPDSRVIINHLLWKGNRFLACSSSASIMLFDSQGGRLQEYRRGDPYVRDQRSVFGHTKAVTGIEWFNSGFVSCSEDGTIRVWDIERPAKSTYSIICNKINQQVGLSSICPLSDKLIASANNKGLLSIWDYKLPNRARSSAQVCDSEFNLCKYDEMLVVRSEGIMKYYDLRSLKEAVREFEVESMSCVTKVQDQVATCSGKKVLFFDKSKLVKEIEFDKEVSVVAFDQDMMTIGHSDGSVALRYPDSSKFASLPKVKVQHHDVNETVYVPDDDGVFYEPSELPQEQKSVVKKQKWF